MNTNQTTATCAMLACALLVSSSLSWPSAIAATQGETALLNAPPVHEKLAAGRGPVKVRWVRSTLR